MKRANVYVRNILAGILIEDDLGYEFIYDSDYLKSEEAEAVSLTLPLSAKPYRDKVFLWFGGLVFAEEVEGGGYQHRQVGEEGRQAVFHGQKKSVGLILAFQFLFETQISQTLSFIRKV